MKKIRYFLEYIIVRAALGMVRILPHCAVKMLARLGGWGMALWPEAMKIACANIKVAFPELKPEEVRRIALKSFFNVAFNMTEFLWMSGRKKRIEKYTVIPEPVLSMLKNHVANNERIIFVNPHLGSWEGSGLMAPHYAGVRMVAIAKPVSNPYLNRLLNKLGREQEDGLQIIQTKGAMRACLKALHNGFGVGTLIDQNTRVRNGGVFVNFFGLPVPSSSAPAVLKTYCDKNSIPAVIIYGTSVRHENGVITAHAEKLSKPFEEYKDEKEVLQELMDISQEYIRRYPEHYLWLYKRFQHIPRGCDPELRKRYPYYAKDASDNFYRKILSQLQK